MRRVVRIVRFARTAVRRSLLGVLGAAVVALGVVWVKSESSTDMLEVVFQEMSGHSVGRQEWSVETYRGALLFDVRSAVYAGDNDAPEPRPFEFHHFSSPDAHDLTALNVSDGFWGRHGFVANSYSNVVSDAPIVTVFGQRFGVPIWALMIACGLWPSVRLVAFAARSSRSRVQKTGETTCPADLTTAAIVC